MTLYAQIYSKHDPSHVEGRDDLDVTAHQKMPVVEPGQDAVPPQSLEVTVSNMFNFPACCIADCVDK